MPFLGFFYSLNAGDNRQRAPFSRIYRRLHVGDVVVIGDADEREVFLYRRGNYGSGSHRRIAHIMRRAERVNV